MVPVLMPAGFNGLEHWLLLLLSEQCFDGVDVIVQLVDLWLTDQIRAGIARVDVYAC